MPSLLVVAWACTSHPLRHKPCCGSVTLLTVNLTSLCFPTVNLSLPFGGCLISLCSETGLLPSNPSESQGDGSPDITWFELYLDFCIATQRNVPWNQGGTCDAPRYAMDPQPGYEIVPRPPLQQTLRNFASSVSHLATHLGARALPTFCVEVKRLSCRPQLVCPSIFQTTLSLYAHSNVSVRGHKSFGTYPVIPLVPPCVTIPEESVDVQFSASRKRAFKARERRRARTAGTFLGDHAPTGDAGLKFEASELGHYSRGEKCTKHKGAKAETKTRASRLSSREKCPLVR